MSSCDRSSRALVVAAALGAVCLLTAVSSADAGPYRWALRLSVSDRHVIATTLPGAAARLIPAARSGRQLTIRAAGPWPALTSGVGRSLRVGHSPSEAEVAEIGWRPEMASALIASRVPSVTSFVTLTPGTLIPATATDWLGAPLRGAIGSPVGGGASTSLDKLSSQRSRN